MANAVAMETTFRRITRTDALAQGFNDHQLARLLRDGILHRIRPGEFALDDEWSPSTHLERHRELVLRTAERVDAPQIYSHHAAAALWGIRLLGDWPDKVDVLVDRTGGGRSTGRIRRHAIGIDEREIVEHEGLLVTSPAQTIIDLARHLPFVDGVIAADSALGTAFGRRRLTTPDELLERLAAGGRGRGIGRARAVVAAADGRSESPPESLSRVGTVLLGFPHPEVQQEFETAGGPRRVDLWWPHLGHVGECDGTAKYTDPAMLRGRDAVEVFRAEKRRDRQLLTVAGVDRITHWEPGDLFPPSRFYRLLHSAGLPSRFPPPRFSSWAGADVALLTAARGFAPQLSA